MADDKKKPVDIRIKEDQTFGSRIVNQVPNRPNQPKVPFITQITGQKPQK